MRYRISLLSIAILIISMTGCYYDKEDLLYGTSAIVDCNTISAKFATDVNPIIQSKCATSGCHDAAGAAGGSILETYAQISSQAARVKQRCVIDKTMPTSGPLLPTEVAIIKCWVDGGALNN
jgi:uncharacterized membrane protein